MARFDMISALLMALSHALCSSLVGMRFGRGSQVI